jgi:hypothetical protein
MGQMNSGVDTIWPSLLLNAAPYERDESVKSFGFGLPAVLKRLKNVFETVAFKQAGL